MVPQVCLYCDAYEYRGQALGAYGNGERGVHIAFEVRPLVSRLSQALSTWLPCTSPVRHARRHPEGERRAVCLLVGCRCFYGAGT